MRNKSPKRRVKAKLRAGRSPATAANQVWAMDFVHDQLFDDRKLRALTVVDTFTRLAPAIEVRQSWRGSNIVAARRGCRSRLSRHDPARRWTVVHSKELDLWAFMHEVTLHFSRPGKPTDNAFIESFKARSAANV